MNCWKHAQTSVLQSLKELKSWLKRTPENNQKVQASTTTEQGGLVHPLASLPVIQILLSPQNLSSRQYVTPTFSNLVQLPRSMKTKPLRLLRTWWERSIQVIELLNVECLLISNFFGFVPHLIFLSWCKCCGYSCGEVKCQYCLDGVDFESYTKKGSSCLEVKMVHWSSWLTVAGFLSRAFDPASTTLSRQWSQ